MEQRVTAFPQARVSNLVTKEMHEEVLVYDLQQHKAHCLNPTAAQVWKYCDGKTSVATITEKLAHEWKTEISEDLVWLALAQLHRSHLLENASSPLTMRTDLSRRQVLRRLAGAALLPVVTSIIAPIAQAGMTCLGQSCSNNDECGCSGCCNTNQHICTQAAVIADGAPCASPCQCLSGECTPGAPPSCISSQA